MPYFRNSFMMDFVLILHLLLYLLFAVVGVQLLYYFFLFLRLAFYKKNETNIIKKEEPVSIIICARNEIENLKKTHQNQVDEIKLSQTNELTEINESHQKSLGNSREKFMKENAKWKT